MNFIPNANIIYIISLTYTLMSSDWANIGEDIDNANFPDFIKNSIPSINTESYLLKNYQFNIYTTLNNPLNYVLIYPYCKCGNDIDFRSIYIKEIIIQHISKYFTMCYDCGKLDKQPCYAKIGSDNTQCKNMASTGLVISPNQYTFIRSCDMHYRSWTGQKCKYNNKTRHEFEKITKIEPSALLYEDYTLIFPNGKMSDLIEGAPDIITFTQPARKCTAPLDNTHSWASVLRPKNKSASSQLIINQGDHSRSSPKQGVNYDDNIKKLEELIALKQLELDKAKCEKVNKLNKQLELLDAELQSITGTDNNVDDNDCTQDDHED